jgi:hypothetical protein
MTVEGNYILGYKFDDLIWALVNDAERGKEGKNLQI